MLIYVYYAVNISTMLFICLLCSLATVLTLLKVVVTSLRGLRTAWSPSICNCMYVLTATSPRLLLACKFFLFATTLSSYNENLLILFSKHDDKRVTDSLVALTTAIIVFLACVYKYRLEGIP